MDLKTFLLARIDEDEAEARAALRAIYRGDRPVESWEWDYYMLNEGVPPQDDAERHVAKWWPVRVLAECAAKRAIIEQHAPISLPGVRGKEQGCPLCGNYERGYGWETVGPCATLKSLAAVHADHPDYQPEWAQEASQA